MVLRVPTKKLRVQAKEKGGKITTKGRRGLPRGQFALPDGNRPGVAGRYPIDSIERARNALARAAQNETPATEAAIRRRVYAKYPGLKKRAQERGK